MSPYLPPLFSLPFRVTTFKQVGVRGSLFGLLLLFPPSPNWLKKPEPCDKRLSATHSCGWYTLSDRSAHFGFVTDSHVKHFNAKPLNRINLRKLKKLVPLRQYSHLPDWIMHANMKRLSINIFEAIFFLSESCEKFSISKNVSGKLSRFKYKFIWKTFIELTVWLSAKSIEEMGEWNLFKQKNLFQKEVDC